MPGTFAKDLQAAVAAVVNPRFDRIEQMLAGLQKSETSIMSTEAQLQSTLDSIQAQSAVISTSMANLNSQIATLEAGQPVTQAQLDALNAGSHQYRNRLCRDDSCSSSSASILKL